MFDVSGMSICETGNILPIINRLGMRCTSRDFAQNAPGEETKCVEVDPKNVWTKNPNKIRGTIDSFPGELICDLVPLVTFVGLDPSTEAAADHFLEIAPLNAGTAPQAFIYYAVVDSDDSAGTVTPTPRNRPRLVLSIALPLCILLLLGHLLAAVWLFRRRRRRLAAESQGDPRPYGAAAAPSPEGLNSEPERTALRRTSKMQRISMKERSVLSPSTNISGEQASLDVVGIELQSPSNYSERGESAVGTDNLAELGAAVTRAGFSVHLVRSGRTVRETGGLAAFQHLSENGKPDHRWRPGSNVLSHLHGSTDGYNPAAIPLLQRAGQRALKMSDARTGVMTSSRGMEQDEIIQGAPALLTPPVSTVTESQSLTRALGSGTTEPVRESWHARLRIKGERETLLAQGDSI
ncbi:hypothetical protein EXIGLDRAFT_745956 [Exidia glandulosa HHB12029]|uniref:Uncharacterized protein n=1 Tax=Exidia glandulosa HHB12029 TaxID=1314781 RepID=A0A165MWJ0_EXIGL|nr:hypothetical protein EXIGLDRAFT_745956 [Exidia glandulosa HHB12029]